MDVNHRCPRKLKGYPTKPCELGRREVYPSKNGVCQSCPWGVKSKEANHCMWLWLELNPGENTATKIAEELNITTQRVGQIKKRTLEAIRKNFPNFYKKFTLLDQKPRL